MQGLNVATWHRLSELQKFSELLRIQFPSPHVIDFGVNTVGGINAGLELATACLGGLGEVQIRTGASDWPMVQVATDQPAIACMGNQYGGWPVQAEKFYAIGSGPARMLRGKEKVLEQYGWKDAGSECGVLILESGKLPGPDLVADIKTECGIEGDQFWVCVAPTRSLAGSLQIVARSVEAVMHKLFELDVDLNLVTSAIGVAPLPAVAADDLTAIGRTNDAILYGGDVTLWVNMPDEQISEWGPQVPSNSSCEFGRPFAELFSESGGDFYKLDPMLFSAGRVRFISNLSGNDFQFGELRSDLAIFT